MRNYAEQFISIYFAKRIFLYFKMSPVYCLVQMMGRGRIYSLVLVSNTFLSYLSFICIPTNHLSIYSSNCLYIYLSTYLSIYQSIYLSIHLSIYPSPYISAWHCLRIWSPVVSFRIQVCIIFFMAPYLPNSPLTFSFRLDLFEVIETVKSKFAPKSVNSLRKGLIRFQKNANSLRKVLNRSEKMSN